MLRFVVLTTFVAYCAASGYGGSGASGSAGGYGGTKSAGASASSSAASSGAGYGGSSSGAGYGSSSGFASSGAGMANGYAGGNSGAGAGQVIQAAIQTRHQIEFRDVPSTGSVSPTTIEVGANSVPLNILFRSASSNLNIQQAHDGAQGSVQESQSEDEPHRLVHSVTKPIIQEVHEVITPFRKITQEIQPVQEEILTIVARGQEQQGQQGGQQAYAGGSSSGQQSSASLGASAKQTSSYGGSSSGSASGASSYGGSSGSAGSPSASRKGY